MSVENGCDLSWSQFWRPQPLAPPLGPSEVQGGYIGSILKINFGKDIGLSDAQCPGLLGTFQLQLDVTFRKGPLDEDVNYQLFIVTVSEGVFTIEDNRSIAQIGVMTPQDILSAQSSPFVDMKTVKSS